MSYKGENDPKDLAKLRLVDRRRATSATICGNQSAELSLLTIAPRGGPTMVDISAIAGVVSALKGATDIARAMKDLNDAAAIQGKVIQLNAKILDAQSSAFAANDERLALIERASELEKEVARLKAWDAEKERYQFAQVSTGVFAYTLKPSMAHGEPSHMLCANCYQRGEKSVLQATQELRKARRVHRCHHCEAEYELTGSATNPAPTRANSDFDVFTGK